MKKLLNIVKYNKNIKKRINIDINDYKEFSGKLSYIEIEIKPVNDKYGRFINFNEDEEKFYRLYFNDNRVGIKNQEINRYNYLYIKKIKIRISNKVKSFESLFKNCECIESICFKKFCRNNIDNMSSMFYGCSALKELNFINFYSYNVKNMSHMF